MMRLQLDSGSEAVCGWHGGHFVRQKPMNRPRLGRFSRWVEGAASKTCRRPASGPELRDCCETWLRGFSAPVVDRSQRMGHNVEIESKSHAAATRPLDDTHHSVKSARILCRTNASPDSGGKPVNLTS
jgi:hypothetical protein